MVPDHRAQFAAADAALGVQDVGTKLAYDAVIGFAARHHHLMAQFIGFDKMATQLGQRLADEALAAREAAGQPYSEHGPFKCCSAMSTVFDISIAMVSG